MPPKRVSVDRRPSSRRSRRMGPLVDVLEERLLFSLTTMVDPTDLRWHGIAVESSPPAVHHAPLSGSESGGSVTEQAPEFVGFEPVILGEDANDYFVDLSGAFLDPSGGTLEFELLQNSNPELFESLTVEGDQLKLNLARHAFGEADVTIRAIADGGDRWRQPCRFTVLPMNDRPTTTGILQRAARRDSDSAGD